MLRIQKGRVTQITENIVGFVFPSPSSGICPCNRFQFNFPGFEISSKQMEFHWCWLQHLTKFCFQRYSVSLDNAQCEKDQQLHISCDLKNYFNKLLLFRHDSHEPEEDWILQFIKTMFYIVTMSVRLSFFTHALLVWSAPPQHQNMFLHFLLIFSSWIIHRTQFSLTPLPE